MAAGAGLPAGQAARGAIIQSEFTERIQGVRVSDIMDAHAVAIPVQTPVAQALDEFFLRYRSEWLPVVDETGHFVGIARQERAQASFDAGEGWLTVGAVLEPEETTSWRVDAERPISELLGSESLPALGALIAVDADGVMRGVVTIDQLRRALQSAFGSLAKASR